jgi:putative transposase
LFPVAVACQVLEVSTAGYYASLDREPSPRVQRSVRIRQSVQEVHAQSHGIYGSLKIAEALDQRGDQERACRNTVAQAMREMGLKSRVSRRFTPTTTLTDPTRAAAPNTLNRDFTAEAPNRKWVTDITYLPTAMGWVYLAVELDLFSRKVVGWAISTSLQTDLVSTALRRAIEARRPDGRRLLHHSDRGCQYTSEAYHTILTTLGIECSMSRMGCCYDNAVMERFFWSLKHEWIKHECFAGLEAAQRCVFKYIEMFYNTVRLHQTLGYQSPNQFEADHAPATAAQISASPISESNRLAHGCLYALARNWFVSRFEAEGRRQLQASIRKRSQLP